MSDVDFLGENENTPRFVPQNQQFQVGGQEGGKGMIGLAMRWFGVNESVANYILIGIAATFFIIAAIVIFI